ncbi:hypothetical protein HUT06_03750 [Actinomadura sp. NAK00032]|uniref:hypothetical protein n=1 Tax=Actinomadura sp. NAK00032 TaxID=2742128 RepID=UPI0015924A7A|nr:hypothetical protein [Actinomadura sp. NAK00032]QKW33255.1 hypothetical protein HUT06_03750 [Actinomadura sp. NAK00032]
MSQIDRPAVKLLQDMASSLDIVVDLDVEELGPGFFAVEVSDARGEGAPITMHTCGDGSVMLIVGDGGGSGPEYGSDGKSVERFRVALHGLFTGRTLVENYGRGKSVRVWDDDGQQVLAYDERRAFGRRGRLLQRAVYPGYSQVEGS